MATDPTSVISTADAKIPIPTNLGIKTAAQKQLYQTDLEFERSFVSQLMQQMDSATAAMKGSADGNSDDSQSGGSGDDDPSVSGYDSMITDQETSAMMSGGGLGLAAVMYRATKDQLGPDGTGTGTGAETVAQITAGGASGAATASVTDASAVNASASNSLGKQVYTSKAVKSAVPATTGSAAADTAIASLNGSAAPATAAAASTSVSVTPVTTTDATTTDSATTPAAATTTPPTTATPTSVSGADSHLRGFFKDSTASTGWSFINQYGHVAQGVSAPDAHNRVVDVEGEHQLGWGPTAATSVHEAVTVAHAQSEHGSHKHVTAHVPATHAAKAVAK